MTTLFLDAEADNLLPMTSRIWVVVTKVKDDLRVFHDPEEFKGYVLEVKPTRIVGHNHLGFDLEALRKCWNCGYSVGRQSEFLGLDVDYVDTCLLSQFLNPDREGGHSLENLGSIVGCPKMDFRAEMIKAGHIPQGAPKGEEFKQFHPLMIPYCRQDVSSLEKIYHYLLKEVERYNE